MESLKRFFSLFIKHGAPLGLFILLPLLVALFLGYSLINLEAEKHISLLAGKIENGLIDIESEIAPESFLLKVGRGAWFTLKNNRYDIEKFWKYYRDLCAFLNFEPDLYLFDENGNLATPKEFNLKSRFIAAKLWETIDSDYSKISERSIKMRKQFKSFLGNEFKLSNFLDSRDRILPVRVKSKPGYVYWMNFSKNLKEGLLLVFWEKPSVEFRLKQIVKRYNSTFDDGFIINRKGDFESFSEEENKNVANYKDIYRNMLVVDKDSNYIDSNGTLWKTLKINGLQIFAGLKSKVGKFENYHACFILFVLFLSITAVSVYAWVEKQKKFYLSIKTKLVGLFLIAVFTPVMGFSYLGYKYISDMKDNLYSFAWNQGRDLLLNIDRELGRSGNVFRDDFRKLVKDFLKYDESEEVRENIAKNLESYELAVIERRKTSDGSLIKAVINTVISEGMTEVTDAFSKCCIDSMLNTNLMDKVDPVLGSVMTSPECGMTSFWSKPDNVQDFIFGSFEFYLYWAFAESTKYGQEYFFILRTTDKVLREHLRKRILECKTNAKEKDYIIVACNNKNNEWFPNKSLSGRLKSFSKRVVYMNRPIESEITIDSKSYLLLGLNSRQIRGYSFYALYPYEKISNELVKVVSVIVAGIIFFVFMALAIGNILSETFLYPVTRLGDGVRAIKDRNSEFRIEPLQNDEFGDLAENFNKMIGDLKEMELAKYIQESLLPRSIPKMNGYELCFSNRMASAVGGDYFDTMLLDDDHLCIIIGDVSGHGVASALVMAIAKAVLYHGFKETRDLLVLLQDLNLVINTYFSKPPVKKMITLFATIIELSTGKAVYTDSGHNFPMHITLEGKITELAMTGLPIGIMKKMRKQHTDEYFIERGDTVVFYTDGIVEVTNKTDEQYGYQRFKEHLSTLSKKSAEMTLKSLFASYDKWLSGSDPDDDVTCVVLKRLNS